MSAADTYRIGFIDGATKTYALQAERMDQVEQLCKSMYANFGNYAMSHDERELLALMGVFTRRMKELGLLKGEQE